MHRPRVLLLEDDPPLQSLLREVFADEQFDVTPCSSLHELQAGVDAYPNAVVVSDSWRRGEYQHLSQQHHGEIVALGKTAGVILTTARAWALDIRKAELGAVRVIRKPYDLDYLVASIRAVLVDEGMPDGALEPGRCSREESAEYARLEKPQPA